MDKTFLIVALGTKAAQAMVEVLANELGCSALAAREFCRSGKEVARLYIHVYDRYSLGIVLEAQNTVIKASLPFEVNEKAKKSGTRQTKFGEIFF